MEVLDLLIAEYGIDAVLEFIKTGRPPEDMETWRVENSHPYSASTYPEFAREAGDLLTFLHHRIGVHGGDTRIPLHGDPRVMDWAAKHGFIILEVNEETGRLRRIGQAGTEEIDLYKIIEFALQHPVIL
jgi:hypothetical protein